LTSHLLKVPLSIVGDKAGIKIFCMNFTYKLFL
jgi:hypothetical protein